MQTTYPETKTFSWEDKPRWMIALAINIFEKEITTGKNYARRKAYDAAARALKAAEHEHGIESVSSVKMKALLIAAAQEHEWYAIDRMKLRQPPDPDTPPGFKYCRKCKETKEIDGFKTSPSPAKARRYGWKEDTTQKIVHHLCAPCRHAYVKKQNSGRYKIKHRFTDLQLREIPGLKTKAERYKLLHAHIAAHMARVRAAFSHAKVVLHLPEGTVTEYQFSTDYLRQFYESKRVYLNAARDRLEARVGEAAPLPATWGMLLTNEEQEELAGLHERAVASSMAPNKPILWTLKLKEKKAKPETGAASEEVSED